MGELFIRVDQVFGIENTSNLVKIEEKIYDSDELADIKSYSSVDSTEFRVLIVGDSYIHGGGIQFDKSFGQQLKKYLNQSNTLFDTVLVLDVSLPGANTLDNHLYFETYFEKFNPDIVILGYNGDDVLGNMELLSKEENSVQTHLETNGEKARNNWYDFIYNFQFAARLMYEIQQECKVHGFVVSGSRFDQMMKLYSTNGDNWKKSKQLLKRMIDKVNKHDAKFVVLKFSEMTLLRYPKVYMDFDQAVDAFFTAEKVDQLIDIRDVLIGDVKQYKLSKYDGHPNEMAHNKLAIFLADRVILNHN